MTRYLIVGSGGMLGQDLLVALAGRDVTALSRESLDISSAPDVERAVVGHDVVLNAAGYTKVDLAETHEEDAFLVNAIGAENLATAAASTGARLVHISTDYVFDGDGIAPYREDSPLDPRGAYGRSKAEGERRVRAALADSIILRTAWTYGRYGQNFVSTMLRLASERDTVDVVDDQRGQPTWTRDLAERIVEMLDGAVVGGIYHGTNSGSATWFEFAREIFRLAGLDPERVRPTSSANFVRPAPRPAYSVLAHDGWAATGLPPMRSWQDALSASFASGAVGNP